MRTFKLTINEDELKALISHHSVRHSGNFDVERSARIHDLTKRLNKRVDDNNNDVEEQPAAEAKIEGWG